jgi:hypothetical protein
MSDFPGLRLVSDTPDSLDVIALHDRAQGSITVHQAVIRVQPRLEPFGVDIFIAARIGHGVHNLHFILRPAQVIPLLEMISRALTLIGEKPWLTR